MSTFWINDTVEARWRGGDKWYAGLIDRIHDDSYDVVYNDGDREEKVPKDLIRAFESRGRRKKEQEVERRPLSTLQGSSHTATIHSRLEYTHGILLKVKNDLNIL